MKNGVGYITLSDGKVHFLFRKERNDTPVSLVGPATDDGAALQAVISYAEQNGISIERVVIAVDCSDAMLRSFTLPITNQGQLEKAVSFELEESLPINSEELVLAHFRGIVIDGQSHVQAAAVRKSRVAALLDSCRDNGLDVERVDLDVAAFGRACARCFGDKEQCIGLEIGSTRTLFVLVNNGKVAKLSVIPWGEASLTKACAQESGLSPDEVYRAMVLDAEGSQGPASKALRNHLGKFITSLLRESSRLMGDIPLPSQCVVSGEIVRAGEFRKVFEKNYDGTLAVWEEQCLELGLEIDTGQRGAGLAVGYGMADDSAMRFEFLKGEFARPGNTGWMRDVAYVGVLIFSIFLAWAGYMYAEILSGERELGRLRDATRSLYVEALPQVGNNLAIEQYQSILSTRINDLVSDADVDGDGVLPVIETLLGMSGAVAAGTDVEIVNFSLDSKRIDIQGVSPTTKEVDGVRAALADVFAEVKVKNVVADKRAGNVRFEMEVRR